MYNLLDEKWQPALVATDGSTEWPGVLRLLTEAHRYADLQVEVPTQRPALYRQLLLPFLLDALRGKLPADAESWVELFRHGRFTEDQTTTLRTYADQHRSLFDVFDPVRPFAQVPGLRTAKDETKSAAALVATAALGNNVPLFSSRTDGDELRLAPGEATRWLLHTQCWDTGAIKTGVVGDEQAKGGKTYKNPISPLGHLGVVMPRGRTVFETLLLNLPFRKRVLPRDLPQWRRGATAEHPCATPSWEQRPPAGLLDLMSWQSRRVRLVPERDADGNWYVARVVVSAGDRLELTPDDEPHTAWVIDLSTTVHQQRRGEPDEEDVPEGTDAGAPVGTPVKRPLRHVVGRSGWRGLHALLAFAHAPEVPDRPDPKRKPTRLHQTTQLLMTLAEVRGELDPQYPLQLDLTGLVYGAKLGTIEDAFHDQVPLPLAALRHDGPVRAALLEAVLHAEQLADAVNRLAGDLRRATGADPVQPLAWQQAGERLLALLDPLVLALLRDLRTVDDDEDACDARLTRWEEAARRAAWEVAEDLLHNETPGIVSGRTVRMRDGTERTFRLSDAEWAFRGALRRILRRTPARHAPANA
ncbi:type I-E CRISPR-associated protein Cse1/CasA [Streptomyces sp. SCA2-2]|uniref:type I-E CRISPR-associated protein Cse1/CasA n=1 Tax=Streptomyces sp. SCA2-2 TaxID=1563677 RepID=UPI0010222901|nr:type I-E CRISPR-associated protein Cse1/CasA [Streptomyces sp. SCA2-2]RZE97306.1 type I-E CRISPR-associated protein Cse1/CasA [Streptomyces sp. SCA2-2]